MTTRQRRRGVAYAWLAGTGVTATLGLLYGLLGVPSLLPVAILVAFGGWLGAYRALHESVTPEPFPRPVVLAWAGAAVTEALLWLLFLLTGLPVVGRSTPVVFGIGAAALLPAESPPERRWRLLGPLAVAGVSLWLLDTGVASLSAPLTPLLALAALEMAGLAYRLTRA